jgi:hypothetical protein
MLLVCKWHTYSIGMCLIAVERFVPGICMWREDRWRWWKEGWGEIVVVHRKRIYWSLRVL